MISVLQAGERSRYLRCCHFMPIASLSSVVKSSQLIVSMSEVVENLFLGGLDEMLEWFEERFPSPGSGIEPPLHPPKVAIVRCITSIELQWRKGDVRYERFLSLVKDVSESERNKLSAMLNSSVSTNGGSMTISSLRQSLVMSASIGDTKSPTVVVNPNDPAVMLHVEVDDAPSEAQLIHLSFGVASRFIFDCLKAGRQVFVHCQRGMSRSSTVLIATLMSIALEKSQEEDDIRQLAPFTTHAAEMFANGRPPLERTAPEALGIALRRRSIVRPNAGFLKALADYQVFLQKAPQTVLDGSVVLEDYQSLPTPEDEKRRMDIIDALEEVLINGGPEDPAMPSMGSRRVRPRDEDVLWCPRVATVGVDDYFKLTGVDDAIAKQHDGCPEAGSQKGLTQEEKVVEAIRRHRALIAEAESELQHQQETNTQDQPELHFPDGMDDLEWLEGVSEG